MFRHAPRPFLSLIGAAVLALVALDADAAKKSDGGPVYVEMDPLHLPIFSADAVDQTLLLVFTLEVPDSAAADKVRVTTPRLSDAFIGQLFGVLGEKGVIDHGRVDVDRLKDELTRASRKILGDEIVKHVLIQRVSLRRH